MGSALVRRRAWWVAVAMVVGFMSLMVAPMTVSAHTPVPRASVGSTGASDTARCVVGVIDQSSGGVDSVELHCYYAVATSSVALSFTAGADVVMQGVVGSSRSYVSTQLWGAAGALVNNAPGCQGTVSGSMAYVGPQIQAPYGSIPAGAVAFHVVCSNAGTFAFPGLTPVASATTPRAGAVAFEGKAQATYAAGGANGRFDGYGTAGSYYWGGTSSSSAFGGTMAWPPDWFPGGAVWSTGNCPGLSVSGVSATTPRYSGDVLPMAWTITAGTGFISASYRWVGLTGAAGAWSTLVSPGTISLTGTTNITFPTGQNGRSIQAVGLEIRCQWLNTGVETFSYKRYESTGFDNVAANVAGCEGTSIRWPESRRYAAGETALFRVAVGPGLGVSLIEGLLPFGDVVGGDLTAWATLNVTADATGAAVTPYAAGPLAAGFTGFVALTFPSAADLSAVRLRCTNVDGSKVTSDQWARGVGSQAGDPIVTKPDGCGSDVQLGWNPSSWVPGMIALGTCWAYELVVPSESQMNGILAKINDLRTRPPLQWADAGQAFILGSSLTFGSWAEYAPDCITIVHSSVCPRTWEMGDSLVPGWMRSAILFGLWTLTVVTVWRFF